MLSFMRAPYPVFVIAAAVAVASAFGQSAKPTAPAKPGKLTKAPVTVTFEAHNEGSVEGPIYGDGNLVTVTIDSAGIRYAVKNASSVDKPLSLTWAQVSGWQANNFTSKRPGRAVAGGGDFGIGIYLGIRYFSFRTRNGRDYIAALKALRGYAYAKERSGIG